MAWSRRQIGALAVFLGFNLVLALGADKETDGNTVVNILFIYQDPESRSLFEMAIEFFKDSPPLKTAEVGKIYYFNANFTDSVKLTTAFCEAYDKALGSAERPDIAIDFTRIGISSEGVKVALAALQMPTIAATFGQEGDVREWRNLNATQEKYMIQVSPPADVLVQAVRSIVEKQNMTSAVLMFDDEQFEMHHKYKSLLQNMPTRHLLTRTESARGNLTGQIERLVLVDIANFFIAGKVEQISEVLKHASNPKMREAPYFSDEYAWYSMSLIPGDKKLPHCTACETDVTLVHLMPDEVPLTHPRRKFLGDKLGAKIDVSLTHMFYFDIAVDAIHAVATLKSAGKYNLNNKNYTCEFYPKDNNVGTYTPLDIDLFQAFKATTKDNMIKFQLNGKTGTNYADFTMTIKRFVFEKMKAAPKSTTVIGKWKAGFTDAKDGGDLIKFEKGQDLLLHLAHTVYRVVTFVQPPFVMRYENCNSTGTVNKYKNCFYGYCIDLLEKIKAELKFNYTIRDVPDGYGYMNETFPHEWNGMVRELKHRHADIALGAMSVMAERESVVDFTVPYYDLVGISILMKKPRVETSLFKFLTVLENDVWMCILGAYFFTSFLMWVFDRWSPYSYQNNREKYEDDEEKREFNLKECLWFCMTSLTPQGGGEAPKNLSGRLVAATWWLFGFIIIASYTANLAAFLTVSRLDAPIESLEDLSKQYKVQYAPMVGSSAWIYFDRMAHIEHRFYEIWKDMSLNDSMTDFERSQLAVWDYPVSDKYTKMWQAMTENTPPLNFTGAIERVRAVKDDNSTKEKDGFAFLDEATNVKWVTTIDCDFDQKGEEFSRKPYAIAVQKGSPLKESISHMILKLLNQRYLEQLKETWWNENKEKKKCDKDDNQSDGISIHNIGGVFIVIFVGIVMACFTLIFEYFWYKKRNVSEELADMALPPPKEFGASFTASPPTIEKTNFNTQYDKPPERTTLPSIENSW